MNLDLSEELALVTGGTRGIGYAIARALVDTGARVVLTGRDPQAATEAARTLASAGGEVHGEAVELADPESIETLARRVDERCGKVSILINNAGIVRDNLLRRMKPEEWDLVIQSNLGGVFRLCRALLPGMIRARRGRIVNISSVIASMGNAGQVNYAAAKAGLEGFTRSLAREVGSRNVTVNCVAPGFIETDMTRGLPATAREKLIEQIPLRRLGRPEDVAGAVLFLVGPGGAYVSGTTVHVNGGMYM